METKTLGELIRDYGRAMQSAGAHQGTGGRYGAYGAAAERVRANGLYAEIEKRLINDDAPHLTSQNTSRGARPTFQSRPRPASLQRRRSV